MKKLMIFLTAIVVVLLLVVAMIPKPVSDKTIQRLKTKSDFVKVVDNDALKDVLGRGFSDLADEISFVSVHHKPADHYYYYAVAGAKDGQEVVFYAKAHKSDIEDETYTYIDFASLKKSLHPGDDIRRYCYARANNQICISAPRGVICGVVDRNGNCN